MKKWMLFALLFNYFLGATNENAFKVLYFPPEVKSYIFSSIKQDVEIQREELYKLFNLDFVKNNITHGFEYSLFQNTLIENCFLMVVYNQRLNSKDSEISDENLAEVKALTDKNVDKVKNLTHLFKRGSTLLERQPLFCCIISNIKDSTSNKFIEGLLRKKLIEVIVSKPKLFFTKSIELEEYSSLDCFREWLNLQLCKQDIDNTLDQYNIVECGKSDIVISDDIWNELISKPVISIYLKTSEDSIDSDCHDIASTNEVDFNSNISTNEKETNSNNVNAPFKCELCDVICTSQEVLDYHLNGKRHQYRLELKNSGGWNCALCNVKATNEHGYLMHLQGAKHKKKFNALVACIYKFPDKYELLEQLQDEERCFYYKYSNDIASTNEKETNSNNINAPFRCELCNVICTSQETLDYHLNGKRHQHRLELKNSGGWNCALCNIKTTNEHGYLMHLQGANHKQKFNTLVVCIYKFPDKYELLEQLQDEEGCFYYKYQETGETFYIVKKGSKEKSHIVPKNMLPHRVDFFSKSLKVIKLGEALGLEDPKNAKKSEDLLKENLSFNNLIDRT